MRRGGGPPHGPPHVLHPPAVTSAGSPAFPQCAADVLQRMAKGMRQSAGPGKFRTHVQHTEWEQQIDNELFCLTADQFHISKLTPLQRLQLLEVIARFFNDKAEDPLRYTFFEAIFLAHEGEPSLHEQRMDFLYNFASYLLQCPVVFVFTTISQWLSKPTTQRVYAEKLIALLVDHYIKPDASTNMHVFLCPLDNKCPEFISLFITLAHRTSPVNESLAIVYGTFMQNNFSYLLSQFRDESWMAEEFAKEVFPKCLSYVLSIEPSETSAPSENPYRMKAMYALCAGLLPIIQGWQKKVKDIELDADALFDKSYPWTMHRSDLLVIYGKISQENSAKVTKFMEDCYPPHWVTIEISKYLIPSAVS